MPRKPKKLKPVRQHDPLKPSVSRPLPPGASIDSTVSQGAELQARRLLHKAGGAANAKRMIDKVIEREAISNFREDAFAARWGFRSRAELLSASQPLFNAEDSSWWATQIPDGRWIVWGDDDLSAEQAFASLEDARRAVGDGIPDNSPLGT
jgi:hypothetical protein